MAYAIGAAAVKKEPVPFDRSGGRRYGPQVAGPDLRHLYRERAPRAPEGRFTLEDVIPGEGPIELDIGFGRGLSLLERAECAPDSRIVGIEVKTKLAYKVDQRLRGRGIRNVTILCGDAREILKRIEPARSIARVSLHFPDPWWKKRHDKRRVIGDALLTELTRLMRPGAVLFIQTDVEHRAAEYVEALRARPELILATPTGFVDDNPFGARSNRERRAIEDGLPIWRIVATRR